MKTPEYYLDEVAKENGYPSIDKAYFKATIHSIVKEAMLRHSKEACEEQKKLCLENAKSYGEIEYEDYHDFSKGIKGATSWIDEESILNAKSPIE